MPTQSRSALILGAGISGLSAAWHLQELGWQVTVLESSNRVGGVIASQCRDDGFLVEQGPSEMLLKSAAVESVLHRIGLRESIQEANRTARKRFITRNGSPIPVPTTPGALLRTRLWSGKAKLRVLREPWVGVADPSREESVAEFVRRRLGGELLDYAIDPLVSGIFAGDPSRLSMRHAFPKVWQLESNYGSLIRGAFGQWRERRRSGLRKFPHRLISFSGGMGQLPKTLAARLTTPPHCGVKILDISREANGWSIQWIGSQGKETQTFGAVVCAVPTHRLPSLPLPKSIKDQVEPLSTLPYAPVVTVTTGYRKDQLAHPLDGFGVLHPSRESRSTLGTLFLSTLFPGRAPTGYHNLITFVGGVRTPDAVSWPVEEILLRVKKDHQELLGAHNPPCFQILQRWPRAIPQYNQGHAKYLDILEKTEERHPGWYFCGNYRDGPGIGDCLLGGQSLAKRIQQPPETETKAPPDSG